MSYCPAAQQPYKIIAIKIGLRTFLPHPAACWPPPSSSGSPCCSPGTSTFGATLVSNFKCNHLNFQSGPGCFWPNSHLLACLTFQGWKNAPGNFVCIYETNDASKIVLPKAYLQWCCRMEGSLVLLANQARNKALIRSG